MRYSIAVGMPAVDMWSARFGLSLARLCCYYGMAKIAPDAESQSLHIISSLGSMLSQQRENLIMTARRTGASHLLMLDTDMSFPRDALHRLMAHGKDIVAANCVAKRIPTHPIAIGFDDKRVFSDPEKRGLERVKQVGAAVMLVRLAIFDSLPRPWFYQQWNPALQHYMGEDVYFCYKATKHGFDVWIDHDLSKEIGHVGPFTFTHDLVGDVDGMTNEMQRNVIEEVVNA